MRNLPRKTATRVRDGRVEKKNRWAPTPTYFNTSQPFPVIDREPPGPGYRHLLRKRDLERFIELLPDWPELSKGLDAVLLARGEFNCAGWHASGVVGLCAWQRELWWRSDNDWVAEHRELLARLEVPMRRTRYWTEIQFTESTARAFQLLHVFLHELGHHRDRMTTRSRRTSRGESFAEQYARAYEARIWDRYFEIFGLG